MNSSLKLLRVALIALVPSLGFALPNLYNLNSHAYTIYPGNAPAAGYKVESNGVESGDASLIAALNPILSSDKMTATVTWNPTGSVDIDVIYVKAGKQYAMFDVSDIVWKPYDGFTVNQKMLYTLVSQGKNKPLKKVYQAISHVSLDGQVVPDGGTTALLLGLGILSAGVIARRRKA